MHSLITLLIMETIPVGSNLNKEVVILSHGLKAASIISWKVGVHCVRESLIESIRQGRFD